MKITRFAQSCLLIETNGKRILIDPGNIQYQESYLLKEWADIDILLVTHKHRDHCHVDAIKEIAKNHSTNFYSSQEVAEAYPEIHPTIVRENDVLSFDAVKVEVVKAVHGWASFLKGGREIYENIGFIIDDGSHRLYQTSDTISFENNYACDILFLPVVNHGLVMGPWDAALFAQETGASLVVPFHYDNPEHPADFEIVQKEFEARGLNYRFLNIGEAIEL
ncbi:MAG: MBL fold metallo-hydrolase [Patescibacteria group bacterium]